MGSRLSALTNLEILKQSQSLIVQLLYYAKNLELEDQNAKQAEDQLKFLIDQLTDQTDEAQKNLVDAYKQLDTVKIECDAIDKEIRQKTSRVRELNDQITRELKDDAAQQAIFTGALKLAAGLLHVIPVGQPYLGNIGGGCSITSHRSISIATIRSAKLQDDVRSFQGPRYLHPDQQGPVDRRSHLSPDSADHIRPGRDQHDG